MGSVFGCCGEFSSGYLLYLTSDACLRDSGWLDSGSIAWGCGDNSEKVV